MDNLAGSIKQVNAGDMTGAEAMLFAQAQALQAMFTNFSRRALKQEYQKNLESFFRMALKAQNQCRMTLETLANIKNPPVVIARQANINNGGQQQINNNGIASNPCLSSDEPTLTARESLQSWPDRTIAVETATALRDGSQ